MIDLEAQGPVYRGHKLSIIVHEYNSGRRWAAVGGRDYAVTITRGWASLATRLYGNVWGLSALDAE